MWKFLVKNQSIEILEREVLADHQIQYVQFKFTFDGDWKRYHKTVQFSQCDDVYSIVLGTDGTSCYLPAELHVGACKMSIFGYDTESDTTVRATTVPVTLNIRASGFEGDDPPIPPTPDLYQQLLKKIEDAEEGKDGKSAFEIAVEHGYVGTEEEWLLSLHGADGADGHDGADGQPGQDGRDGVDGQNGQNGADGKSAYQIAVEHGYSGTEAEWLESLKADVDLSPYATTASLNEQILLVREAISPLEYASHTHQNQSVLDNTTASYTTAEKEKLAGINLSLYATTEALNAEALSIRESITPLARESHTHSNKSVLDNTTAPYTTEEQTKLSGIEAGANHTVVDTHLDENSMNAVANAPVSLAIDVLNTQAHTHANGAVLEGITAAKVELWDSVSTVKTQVNGLSTELTVYKSKCDNNSSRIGVNENDIDSLQTIVESLQAQIDNLHPYDTSVTVFKYGTNALSTYGESIYTFYNDGYRSLAGFTESYPTFCAAANDYALYYNQSDFSWGGIVYTMNTESVRVTPSKSILISYKSGANDTGEMWLVPKNSTTLSPADTARYIYEKIQNNGATAVPFNWLYSPDNYITVLLSCSTVTAGDYYLAWKGVSDNTHPYIRNIKVLEVAE